MKKVLFVSLSFSIFALVFSIIISLIDPIKPNNGQSETAPPSPGGSAVSDAEYVYQDDTVSVRVLIGGKVTPMTMSRYLIGVVAAEMPASFGMEALKAQAVAARTETLYHMLEYTSQNHPDADVCADPSCCQAYKSEDELRQKWGDTYDGNIKKITEAVHKTDSECLTYGNIPIQAVFHSSSAGLTANSGEVWENNLPYLVSVKSPESAADVPNYVSSVTVSLSDFKQTVLKHYPDAVFPGDVKKWVTDIAYTDSGRIGTVKLGGVMITGPVLRSMFGLRSTAASIKIDDNNVVFTTTGYGHGVGMSQYGANAFAQAGKSYKDILIWYYKGITFTNEKDILK